MYWFLYNQTTGEIITAASRDFGWVDIPSTLAQIAYPSTDATAAAAYAAPTRWIIQNNTLIPLPYWTVTQSTASGTTTLTATLENPPATPPTSATATIGQSSLTLPLTSGTGALSVQAHPSLQAYGCPVTISAARTAPATTVVGQGPPPPIGLQAIAPTTSGDPVLIAPAGPGSKAFLRQQALGALTLQEQLAAFQLGLQNLAVLLSSTVHFLVTRLIPWAQQTTYSPLSTTAEQAALTTLTNDLVPNLLALADLVSNGNPIPPLADAIAQAPTVQQALTTYSEWVLTLPNLE